MDYQSLSANEQMEKILVKPSLCDLFVMVKNPPYIEYSDCIHKSANFDLFNLLKDENRSQWGTSILYEQGNSNGIIIRL